MRSFAKLVAAFRRLPGIGPKQAERMAVYLVRASGTEAEALVAAVREVKAKVRTCSVCCDFSEEPVCPLCADPARDAAVLCVVEEPADLAAIERSRGFRGRYHVLHGSLAPLDGIGPDRLRVGELLHRLGAADNAVREVILATSLDTEGETTALYLAKALAGLPVKVTRIAMGVPMGGDLAYSDERTLAEALDGRRAMSP